MKGWGIVPAVLVLGLARSSPVWGEQQEPILLEEVQVTAARAPRIAFDVPTGVTVVGPEEISRQTPQVLSDLMRGAAGVFVQQTTPGQATAIVRGLKGSEVLHLVDGMRLNNAFFRNAPNQYLALVDPYNVERVEVVRGPASTLYGSDAMGGVVQVITPVPRFDTEEWQVQGRALGQFASAELAGVTRLSVEGGKRGIALRGGFTYQNVDDRRAGGGHRQRPSGFTAHAADGTMVLTLGSNHEVLLNVQYLRQPKTPRFDELVAGFGQTQPSADVFFFEPNDRLFLHGRYRTLQPVAFIDLVELNVAHQQIDDDRRIRDFGSSEEDRERNQSALTGITLQGISEAGERMNFTYGGELYLDTINSSRKRTNILTGERVAVRSRFPDGSTMNSFALYVRDEIRLSPPLVATFGGRFSHFDLDLPGTDGETGTTLSFHDVTGSFGLRYRLTPVLNLVANVGRGFRAPNVFDLGTSGPRPGNRFNIANPDLGPEKIVTVDWGVKLQAPRLQGQVFGFYSDFTDKIESVLTGDQTPDGRDVVQSRNVNRVILW
ncbi:MAG: TonB-dependent receptor plug domain-containing protein, partial [Candidatus Binatia bacterium]